MKQRKRKDAWHRFLGEQDGAEIVLVAGSKRSTYLSVHAAPGRQHAAFWGPASLRKLAKEILKLVGRN